MRKVLVGRQYIDPQWVRNFNVDFFLSTMIPTLIRTSASQADAESKALRPDITTLSITVTESHMGGYDFTLRLEADTADKDA